MLNGIFTANCFNHSVPTIYAKPKPIKIDGIAIKEIFTDNIRNISIEVAPFTLRIAISLLRR